MMVLGKVKKQLLYLTIIHSIPQEYKNSITRTLITGKTVCKGYEEAARI